jgi:hypothetical protein
MIVYYRNLPVSFVRNNDAIGETVTIRLGGGEEVTVPKAEVSDTMVARSAQELGPLPMRGSAMLQR